MLNKKDVYITKEGETWDQIAFKVYGDEMLYIDLMQANLKVIDVAVFPANIPLICPDVEPTNNKNLPPWKK